MSIIFVESPTKARTIRRFLKGYYVMPTYGHLFDLPPKEFGLYLKNNQIKAKYVPLRGKNKIINKIKKLAKENEKILIASDPDREGEMIAFEIKTLLSPQDQLKIKRIFVHEITPSAFYQALKNKIEINESLVNAQRGRRFLDRIFGYKISPLLWSVKKGLSAGRVQSAALKIIFDREQEIKNFKKEEYFQVYLNLKNFPLKVFLVDENHQLIKIRSEEIAQIKNNLKKIKKIKLKKILQEKKKLYPPLPLDTENLQRFAYQKLIFSPKKTMFLAQKLFEYGLITYHRTQSHFINKNFSLKLKELIENKYGKNYFSLPRNKKERFSFEAHEAIRPTKIEEPKLKGDLLKLWQLISLITTASHLKPAEYNEHKFIFLNKYIFLGLNKELVFDGFTKILPLKTKFAKIPKFFEGQEFEIINFDFEKIETKPPTRFTEASLIKKLKELGIGRPSTYVQTIETLKKRNYVILEKNSLKITNLGNKVCEYLAKNFPDLINLKFTALIEEKLDKIAQNLLDYQKFVIEFWQELEKKLRFTTQLTK
ncbi:MAG: DNA topoisomerase 1 [Candidatus Parcubacteria bacterium]|nr:MAG: DNA topoisomerase 1 [Candidatus Parcubacteria bacterium]